MENGTTKEYLAEAFVSARRIKALNPTVNITLVTNPDLHPNIDGAFDLVRSRIEFVMIDSLIEFSHKPI